MRRLLGISLVLLAAAGCRAESDSALLEVPTEGGDNSSAAFAIFDATSIEPGSNEHFFFLSPIAPTTPTYSGVADDELGPVITVCDISDGNWDAEAESCGEVQFEFSTDPAAPGDPIQVNPGTGYHVTWHTKDEGQGVTAGNLYRVSVSVVGQVLGYADITAYPNQSFSGHHNTEPGQIAISDNGSLNISFRIEDGALEEEYCDPTKTGAQDCDVEIITPGVLGCLRVFDNPGQGAPPLGSSACIEAAAQPILSDGTTPLEDEYVVILTLEENTASQGGFNNDGWQLPHYPDLKTDPPGINFLSGDGGIDLTICQPNFVDGGLLDQFHLNPEDLPPGWQGTLRPFLIFSDDPEKVFFPAEYEYGASLCDGYTVEGTEDHFHSNASASSSGPGNGWLRRMAGTLASVPRLFLPEPLNARRLHGGLNTTVYDTRGDDRVGDGGGGEPERVAAFAMDGEEGGGDGQEKFIVESGAILDVDPEFSTFEGVSPAPGTVGSEATLSIAVRNIAGDLFPFPEELEVVVAVQILRDGEVVGTISGEAVSFNPGSGIYEAKYTPSTPGTNSYLITIDGEAIGSDGAELPTHEIAPVGPSASESSFGVGDSEAGLPTIVTVDVNDTNRADYTYGYNEIWAPEVLVTVSGANGAYFPDPIPAYDNTDEDGNIIPNPTPEDFDGTYVAVYTPRTYGTDRVSVAINGGEVAGATEPFTTAPRPADATKSVVSAPDGLVDSPTLVSVTVNNTADYPPGEIYDYGYIRTATVLVSVAGANEAYFPEPLPAYDNTDEHGNVIDDPAPEDFDGIYIAVYTPETDGDDIITATVNGVGIPVPPAARSKVYPLSGSLTIALNIAEAPGGVSYLEDGSVPENGWTVELYKDRIRVGAPMVTEADGTVTFEDLEFGDYTVHLPYRDFDIIFDPDPAFPDGMAWPVTHDQKPNTYTITGQQQPVRQTVGIHRLGFGGDGNAHEYVAAGRSWIASEKQALEDVLQAGSGSPEVPGHLVTITTPSENIFVHRFFFESADLCPDETDPKFCRMKGWIGLTDDVLEGEYVWVNGEGEAVFVAWPGWDEATPDPAKPTGNKENTRDHVEIDSYGNWGTINGASSTNDGYFVEFEVPGIQDPFGS